MIQVTIYEEKDLIHTYRKFHCNPPGEYIVMREIKEYIEPYLFNSNKSHRIEITKWEK